MIKPTVGRIVWYWPHPMEEMAGAMEPAPLAAIVTCVWSDTCVNLSVFDANGIQHQRTSILLVQEGNPRPDAAFCEWMPYQKGQAARVDAAATDFSAAVAVLIEAAEICEKNAEIGSDPAQVTLEINNAENFRKAIDFLTGKIAGRPLEHSVEYIARVAHETNRSYCQSLGDDSQPSWEDAPDWQRKSAINGVRFHIANPDAGPDASHNSWMKEKLVDGCVHGPVKDPDLKQHPCIVPFSDLPREQQAKDFLFRSVVHSLK